MSYKEIADQLNISINTVKTQMKVAYKKIKDELDDKNMKIMALIFGLYLTKIRVVCLCIRLNEKSPVQYRTLSPIPETVTPQAVESKIFTFTPSDARYPKLPGRSFAGQKREPPLSKRLTRQEEHRT